MRARALITWNVLVATAVLVVACGREPYTPDAGGPAPGNDAGSNDAGPTDAGPNDAGSPDAGSPALDAGRGPGPAPGPTDGGPRPTPTDGGPGPTPQDAGPGPAPVDAGSAPVDAGPSGVPVRIGFTNEPILLQRGECSGAYPDVPRLRVSVVDGPGEPVPASQSQIVTLGSSSGTLRYFRDSLCTQNTAQVTIGAGESTVTLFIREDVESGNIELTARTPGLGDGRSEVQILP